MVHNHAKNLFNLSVEDIIPFSLSCLLVLTSRKQTTKKKEKGYLSVYILYSNLTLYYYGVLMEHDEGEILNH